MILLVHVLEVFRVTGVLGDILNVHRNIEFNLARFGPVLITDLLDDGDSRSGSALWGGTTYKSRRLLRW